VVGFAVLAVAVSQVYTAISIGFRIDRHLEEMSPRVRAWTFACRRGGYAARVTHSLSWVARSPTPVGSSIPRVGQVGAAFRAVADLPFGPVLLSALALGLIAYGLYLLFAARYLRLIVTW
jgi:hypothetical protein